MPIHDWTRVPAGLWHEFHQSWSIRLKDALNVGGRMPQGYYALVEQRVDGPEPDVIAVQTRPRKGSHTGGTVTLAPPQTRLVTTITSDRAAYARKANRISIRHPLGQVVAIIEIVSPGNKDSAHAVRSFVQKAAAFLRAGVHLAVVDLFPPSPRDPQGLHAEILHEFEDTLFELPPEHPLTVVGYQAASPITAYIEPAATGEALGSVPLFLDGDEYVTLPLEPTYASTWAATPEPIREWLERPSDEVSP